MSPHPCDIPRVRLASPTRGFPSSHQSKLLARLLQTLPQHRSPSWLGARPARCLEEWKGARRLMSQARLPLPSTRDWGNIPPRLKCKARADFPGQGWELPQPQRRLCTEQLRPPPTHTASSHLPFHNLCSAVLKLV